MALPLFPMPAGWSFPIGKQQIMNTSLLEAASGVEYGAQRWAYPRWQFTLPIEFLRQYSSYTEWQTINGFILAQAGRFANWLYDDFTDDTVTNQQIGVGDGVTTSFPLVRAISSYVEPIYYCTALNAVYVGGVLQSTGFSLNQTGYYGPDTIVFNTPPGSGLPVQASFNFNYVCRFMQDDPNFALFIGGRWSIKQLTFKSVK